MDKFIGCMVSLDCGETLGVYQGQVDSINPMQGTITLVRSFRNGIPYKLPHVTLRSQDINHLEIIRSSEDVKVVKEKEQFNILLSEKSMDFKTEAPRSPKPKIAPIKQLVVFGQNKDECRAPAFPEVSFSSKIHHTHSDHLMVRTNGMQQSKQKVSSPAPPNNFGKNKLFLENEQFQLFENFNENDISKLKICNKATSSPQALIYKWPTKQKEISKNQFVRPSNSFTEHCHQSLQRGYDNLFSPSHKPSRGAKRNNSECFDHCDGDFDVDFDFEKNLALFDKAAVAQEMKSSTNNFSYNVQSTKNGYHNHQEKYKCDENVLKGVEFGKRQIFLISKLAKIESSVLGEYSTDSGLVVPGVANMIRKKLFSVAEEMGFGKEKTVEAFGRCISDVILQYLGGSTRFEAKNFHQRPNVVILCGSDQWQSAAAITCGRLLANRSSHVVVYHSPSCISSFHELKEDPTFRAEMNFFKMTGGMIVTDVKDLPVLDTIDLVLSTLDCNTSHTIHADAARWANSKKAPVFSIEPSFAGPPLLESKRSFVCGLPGWYESPVGQVCFCDVGLPESIYKAAGLNFKSPFFDKFYLTLHKVS